MSHLPQAELPATPELSTQQQRENGEHILVTAGTMARDLQARIEKDADDSPVYKKAASDFFADVEAGVCEAGVSRSYMPKQPGLWLQEITWAAAQGRRTIVNLPGFCMVTSKDEDGIDRVNDTHLTKDDFTCSIGGMMRAIRPPHHNMQVNYPVHDYIDPAMGRLFNERARSLFHQNTDEGLRTLGVVMPDDKQGKDYNLLSLARGVSLFRKVVLPYLKESPWGRVVEGDCDSIRFHPHEELLDIAPEQSDEKWREDCRKNGLPIITYGGITDDVLMAASTIWQPEGTPATRLHITDRRGNWGVNDRFMIFRALGLTQRERFHTLRMPSNDFAFSKHLSRYALSREIEVSASRFMESFDYDDFESFDPFEYAMRNYGESILADDRNLCMLTMFALNFLEVKNARAADIGCGPNLYPAMLLEPYSRTIDLLEYSPANRSYLEQWFNGALPSGHQNMFSKFGMLMLGGGGAQYSGVIPRLKEAHESNRLIVAFGDSFNLPKKRWNLLTSSFVGDSITWQKLLFPVTVRQMKDALEDEGVHFSAYMLNEPNHRGYHAGKGKKFPNISQSTEEIRKIYIDNGMECIVIPTAGSEKMRDGYHGMAFVVAAHRGSHMAAKIRLLARPLHEFAAADFGIAA